jgi:hypothetical protein
MTSPKENMGKKVVAKEKMDKMAIAIEKKEAALARLKKDLGEEYACFVLITCTEPDAEGKMEVALDFEGDETLASFLIENAAQVAEDRDISSGRT